MYGESTPFSSSTWMGKGRLTGNVQACSRAFCLPGGQASRTGRIALVPGPELFVLLPELGQLRFQPGKASLSRLGFPPVVGGSSLASRVTV